MASRTNLSKIFLFLAMASFATLTESIQRCKHYPDPKHGHMVCDSLFRLFCTPECDDGFVFKFKPAVVYMCGPMTGKWFTYPEGENIPWPNCIKRQSTDDPAEDEAASRRAQISQKIHDTHSLMLSEKNNQQQMEQIGQLDAREQCRRMIEEERSLADVQAQQGQFKLRQKGIGYQTAQTHCEWLCRASTYPRCF